jgi:hypothetical protein
MPVVTSTLEQTRFDPPRLIDLAQGYEVVLVIREGWTIGKVSGMPNCTRQQITEPV